jgi:hypothetical protein
MVEEGNFKAEHGPIVNRGNEVTLRWVRVGLSLCNATGGFIFSQLEPRPLLSASAGSGHNNHIR